MEKHNKTNTPTLSYAQLSSKGHFETYQLPTDIFKNVVPHQSKNNLCSRKNVFSSNLQMRESIHSYLQIVPRRGFNQCAHHYVRS